MKWILFSLSMIAIAVSVYISQGIYGASISVIVIVLSIAVVEILSKYVSKLIDETNKNEAHLARGVPRGGILWTARIGAFLCVVGIAGFLTVSAPRSTVENKLLYSIIFGTVGIVGISLMFFASFLFKRFPQK
jgi:hypothetical protein